MEKDVVISIKGMQKYEGNDPDTVELVTAGRLMKDKAGYTLSYQESEITGLEGTLTTIQVEGEQVTLMRMGEFNSQMVFQEGRRHLSMYNTPYGAMSVGVNTRHLLADLSDKGGDIEIDYAIEIDNAIAAGSGEGMLTMDQSILALYQAGRITRETALNYADNPEQLRRRMGN